VDRARRRFDGRAAERRRQGAATRLAAHPVRRARALSSDRQALALLVGLLHEDGKLTLRSKIRDGRVFIDGHRIVHAVTIGDVLVMRRSAETLTVLGLAHKRRT